MLRRLADWLRRIPAPDADALERRVSLQGIIVALLMVLAGSYIVNLNLLGFAYSPAWLGPYAWLAGGFSLALWQLRRGWDAAAIRTMLVTLLLGLAALVLLNGLRNTLTTTYLFAFVIVLIAGIVASRRTLLVTLVSLTGLLILSAQLEAMGLIPLAAEPAVWDVVRGRALQTSLVLVAIGVFLSYFNWRLSDALARSRQRERALEQQINERIRTEAALREQHAMVNALRAAAAALNQSLDLQEVLDRLLEAVARVVPHEATDVMLVEGNTARVVRFRHRTRPELEVVGVRLSLAETATLRQMAETGEPCIVADTTTFADWIDVPQQRWVRSYLGAPIRQSGQPIGFLNFTSREAGFYTPAHAEVAKAFVHQAAIAIENARLYTQARDLAAQAQAANRLKGEILANTSHELRTPLTAVQGALNLILSDACDSRAEERQWVTVAYTASDKLLAAINTLLDVAGLEADRIALNAEAVELGWLLREVEGLIRPKAECKHLNLRLELVDPDAIIWADRERVRQVLLSLLDNAVKFTEQGEVTMTLRSVDSVAEVVVRDTGVGLGQIDLARLFEPFAQADGSTTRRFGGSGLGLYVAQRLTQMMGGTLHLANAPQSQGAVATVTFPLRRTASVTR